MTDFIANDELKNKIVSIIFDTCNADDFDVDNLEINNPINMIINFVKRQKFDGSDISRVSIDEHAKFTYNDVETFANGCKFPKERIGVVNDEDVKHYMKNTVFTNKLATEYFTIYANKGYIMFVDQCGDAGVRIIEIV